jgi:hypothetical protein
LRRTLFLITHGLMTGLTGLLVLLVILPKSRIERLLRPRRRPRILWGPTPILTIAINAEADRQRGLTSDTLVYATYYITQTFTYSLHLARRPAWQRLLLPYGVFLWATWKYDIFQFFYDRGLLPGPDRFTFNPLELPLLALAGKKTVLSAYGADVRTRQRCRSLGEPSPCDTCPSPLVACICDDAKGARNQAHIARWAHARLSLGDMTAYTPGSRNDVFYWGIDVGRVPFVGAAADPGRPVRIAHAPNHRFFKGSDQIEAAIAQLQAEGLDVAYTIIQNLPNEEAMRRYAEADIIAEQVVIGWHGYFAIEAMALGKPVVCFIREAAQQPAGEDCPIVNARPETVLAVLRELVLDPERRERLGRQGRAFVERVYDQPHVAERMATVYTEIWGSPS